MFLRFNWSGIGMNIMCLTPGLDSWGLCWGSMLCRVSESTVDVLVDGGLSTSSYFSMGLPHCCPGTCLSPPTQYVSFSFSSKPRLNDAFRLYAFFCIAHLFLLILHITLANIYIL